MLNNLKGQVVIVMAPMGSGKGTLIKHALTNFSDLHLTVSCTTRSMRPGEVDGREYHFISPAEFTAKIEAGEFLEWATFGLNRYGTLKSEIIPRLEQDQVVVAEIEVQGVEQLQQLIPRENMTVVYIEAGGWETLKARALARAPIAEAELEKRYERYLVEVESKVLADVVIDNSDSDFAPAIVEFEALLGSIYSKIIVQN